MLTFCLKYLIELQSPSKTASNSIQLFTKAKFFFFLKFCKKAIEHGMALVACCCLDINPDRFSLSP